MRYTATSTQPLPVALELSDVAAWAQVDGDDQKLYTLLKAAMLWAEGFCDQPLFARTFTVQLSSFSDGILPGINPRAISIGYLPYSDDQLILEEDVIDLPVIAEAETLIRLNRNHVRYSGNGWLRFNGSATSGFNQAGVLIQFTAGYSAEELPENIAIALCLMVRHTYDNPANSVSEKRTAAENYLQPYKHYSV